MPHDADDRLLSPYRFVRRVVAGEAGPWAGTLVRVPSGEAGVLVDTMELPREWRGWDAAAGGHVLAPLDLVRRRDGHDALLPACVALLSEFLARRRAGLVPLRAGEQVTLGVSILRGLAELASDDEGTSVGSGEWWIDDAGRPVLATGTAAGSAIDASLAAIRELAPDPAAPVWDDLLDAVRERRLRGREAARLEGALFAIADPEALGDAPLVSRRARGIVEDRASADPRPRVRDLGASDEEAPRRGWIAQFARHVDADLGDLVSRGTTGLWRRLRARRDGPRGPRRAPWIVAGGVAVAVVAAGLLWPAAQSEPVAAEPGAAQTDAAPSPIPVESALDPAGQPDGSATQGSSTQREDLTAIASGLLSARAACAGDSGCAAAVAVDSARAFDAGPIDLPESERTVVLIDDFGGVAVLRVDATSTEGASQLVVIQREAHGWLLRDVYAAQQP